MKKIKLIAAISMLVLAACESNDDGPNSNNPVDSFSDNWGAQVSRNFSGIVVDISGDPIEGAAIRIGSSTAQTDANGVFFIDGAQVHAEFAYVTATKSGFLDGSRALVPISGRNDIRIKMIPATVTATVAAGSASEVVHSSGAKVSFDGSFEDEDGNAYSGNVSVVMFQLASANPEFSELMPGMLYGQDENGGEAGLRTFGMINVELRGSAGQKLQIADGHTADIEMPIDPSQLATAPESIPLWHFDAERGYWKQDGAATRSGNKYLGEVSHFSWWNCDAYSTVVQLTVTVQDDLGTPIANAGIKLVTANGFTSYIQYTSANGQVGGYVPANEIMTLTVHDQCGDVIHTQTIGPFAVNTNLAPITLTSAMAQVTQIQGTLLECGGNPVSNGYVIIDFNGQTGTLSVSNGNFSLNTFICSSGGSFTLQGWDVENLQQTPEMNYTMVSPVTNIGTLTACDTVDEFITYTIDGGPPTMITGLFNATGGTAQGTIGLMISSTVDVPGFYLWGNVSVPGVYSNNEFSIEGSEIGYIGPNTVNDMVYQLNSYGAVGEYIDMTFNGNYEYQGTTRALSGVIHVKRDQ